MIGEFAGGASLSPPKDLLPPAGCRGAVSAWPQFIRALHVLKTVAWTDPAWTGLAARFGSPAQLLQTLQSDPQALQRGDGPADVYGRYVRLTVVVTRAAMAEGSTLGQLPMLVAAGESAGDLVRQVLVGEGGLAEQAGDVSAFADRFVAWLKSINPGADSVEDAIARFRTAHAGVVKQAAVSRLLETRELSKIQAATRAATDEVRAALLSLEASAAEVTVTAVFDHLIGAVQALADGWRDVADTLRKTVDEAQPGQLADADYLTRSLGVDDSAAAWTDFAGVVKAFTTSLLLPWDTASTPRA